MELDFTKLLESFSDLGEIRAQLRELIADKRNETQRAEVVARTMAKLEDVPAKIDRMENRLDARMEKIENRINILETSDSNRKVVNNVWLEVMKSPAVGWLVATAGAAVAFVTYVNKGI
jgi:DNA repair ATPase RecN